MTTTDPFGGRGKTPCKKCGRGTFFDVCGGCEPIVVKVIEFVPDDDYDYEFSEEDAEFA